MVFPVFLLLGARNCCLRLLGALLPFVPQSAAHSALFSAAIPAPAGAFKDMLTNWVLSVQRLGLPFLVGALDARMTAECAARGWPRLDVSALVQGNESMFRAHFKTFRNMGATKVRTGLMRLNAYR